MLVPIPWVHAGIGLASTLLALPLIARKVPPNRYYGFRLPRAFVSERNWYALNIYGGKWLLAFGVLLLLFAAFGWRSAPPPTSLWAPIYMMVPLTALIPMIAFVKDYERQLPDR